MASIRSTPGVPGRPASPDKGRRYLSPEEVTQPPAAAASEGVGADPAATPTDPPSGSDVASLIQDELARAAQDGKYTIQDMLARGAESVLYRASAGHATFCVKAIRNMLGKTIGSSSTRSHEGKLDVSYRSKVRHLRNEFAVGTALLETGELPVVRIYALRKVRRFGVEMGYDLLMEHIDGADMGDRQFARDLSVVDKIGIFHQTVKALNYMHQRCYIHLDMKPSNIMVTRGRVKLIDFGVSVSLGHRPRAVTGTAGYLSPEQIVRDYLNEATDIFALGVTFAVIFGGKPLRQNPADLKSRQFRSEARYHLDSVEHPTMTDMPELAEFPEVAQLIGQCTVPRRDKRIASTSVLLSRLEHAAAERGVRLPLPLA